MEKQKTFKTKTGFCHILPDRIVLTRDGITGNVAKVTVGKNITKILITYGVISLGLFYWAFGAFQNGKTLQPTILGLLAIFLIYGIVKSLNNSTTPIIDRKKIKEVNIKRAVKGITRSRFEVLFEDEDGKIKKRLILLPGSMTGGRNETVKAIEIMTDEQLLK